MGVRIPSPAGFRMHTVSDVLEHRAPWCCVESDAVAFLNSLPDDSIDLLFTSPPYLAARTYGREDVSRSLGAWVPWMLSVVRAAAPKVKGLIAINCEGQTRNYAYQPAPFLLMAELFRAGFNLRKPVVFHRVGVAGSGGPDWLRNDWEPIVCVTRPGRLPWSEPTACGQPPKWCPGGPMSHRTVQGDRIGKRSKAEKMAMGAKRHTVRDADVMREQAYLPPEIANPGNVLKCSVGGGRMGHHLAHENEAPFPLKLADFFVRSFCPPGGVVCDPFSGSGTTCHAAVEAGRRFVGADIRASQVELCGRRMRCVTPDLFADVEGE